jgi:hypothetical protein
MTAPDWAIALFAWANLKPDSNPDTWQDAVSVCGRPWRPNIADASNGKSLRIAHHVYTHLGVTRDLTEREAKKSIGAALEDAVKNALEAELSGHRWDVRRNSKLEDYVQYEHLGRLRALLAANEMLRDAVGTDYTTKPDVTVGRSEGGQLVLHAVASCKWTIRSDRVQNVRHEFNTLVGARRGRAPHIVAVTAEPLPSRIAALVGGVGGVDTVYHIAFSETEEAVNIFGAEKSNKSEPSQLQHWNEMVRQRRLKGYEELISDLTITF